MLILGLNPKKTLLITAACGVVLFAVNWVSSFAAPCNAQHGRYKQHIGRPQYDECSNRDGAVAAGFFLAADFLGRLEPDTWTAIATLVMSFFTGTLWYTSRQQWKQMALSVDVAVKTAHEDLRAYVDVEDIYFLYKGEERIDAEKRSFTDIQRLRITNYGRTPASDLWIWIENTNASLPREGRDLPFPINLASPTFRPHFLGPTRRFGTRLGDTVRPFTHVDKFYTYGRIQYRDIYGVWHVLSFCYEHIPPRTFRPYGNYNHEHDAGNKLQPRD